VSALNDVWEALRAIIGMSGDIQRLWVEIHSLRRENQELRERLVRIETIIEGARSIQRSGIALTVERQPIFSEGNK